MPYPIQQKIVVAVASSALFDLTDSDRVFREQGVEGYRQFQREHEACILEPGVAFPLVQRLLGLNGNDPDDRPVEIVLLSHNDPDSGLRVRKSIAFHGLGISRAAFVSGGNPFRYAKAFNASLCLSANRKDVSSAIQTGVPAGHVFNTGFVDDDPDGELRIAFDFDVPLPCGPLYRFFSGMAKLQQREVLKREKDPEYKSKVRMAIVTARNAPADERLVMSLRSWGINVDEAFFLGGIDKASVLEIFRPHIFFDDQLTHIESAARFAPCAHIPFGAANSDEARAV